MANPSKLQLTPYHGAHLENFEFNFSNLYLHQMFGGPSPNQEKILVGNPTTQFGETAVNDWAIYEGVDQNAKLVAQARGMHMNAVSWYNAFVMVFEVDSFKGSTLQVMGASDTEWAIVGGTGVFAMARGVIERKLYKQINGGEIQELSINGFCRSKMKPVLTKIMPALGNPGSPAYDIQEKPGRLVSMIFFSGDVLDAMSFTYIDQAGKSRTSGRWGGAGGGLGIEINLGPSEVVKGLSGVVASHGGENIISSLKVVTNVKTYGPFGTKGGTPFTAPVPANATIEGFFGSSTRWMTSIGVYTISYELA